MNPTINWHAIAPELIVAGTAVVALMADLLWPREYKVLGPRIAAVGCLAALIPVITLAFQIGDDGPISLFGGAYVVDGYALAFKGFFVLVAYLTVLLSLDYIADSEYYQTEYYFLLLTSVLGMMTMASARDLVSVFISLETISIPIFVLAGWRKHDSKSNEAMMKFFVIGVLSSAIMLYGMSLIFGLAGGTTMLSEIATKLPELGATNDQTGLWIIAVFATLVGFFFKISAVPFHNWTPDTYEGAPTPVTAFLSVASKAGGFVALVTVLYAAFPGQPDWWQPILWVLAAASLFVGNLTALRQTNMVRLLAYSSIAQAGFILVALSVAGEAGASALALQAVVIYLVIFAVMNLGAFACVIAASKITRSGEISSYSGLYQRNPALVIVFAVFLLSLAGIPPLAGWFAKLAMFRAVLSADTTSATVLAVIAALNTVIALVYYIKPVRAMVFGTVPEGTDLEAGARVSPALTLAIGTTAVLVFVGGIVPAIPAWIGETAQLALG